MYNALVSIGREAVEDCEHGTKACEVVSCEVGDRRDAIGCVVLGAIPTSAG